MMELQTLDLIGSAEVVRVLSDVERFTINERTIVVNPTLHPVAVAARGANVVPPLASRTLRSVDLERAELLVLVQPPEISSLGDLKSAPGWRHHSEITSGARPSESASIPLWRSAQVEIGSVSMAPADLPGQHNFDQTPSSFRLWLSLWYADAGTDCGIHDQHDFIEIHTQIFGWGRMQKFVRNDSASLFEDEPMTPGYTTSVPYCQVAGAGSFDYPWHRYYAETDCLWLALEYCPVPRRLTEDLGPLGHTELP
jgi:hypothetical protein